MVQYKRRSIKIKNEKIKLNFGDFQESLISVGR